MEDIGSLLRDWRTRRRMSQLDLASEAEVSTRHLSCLENGRARPSREMVLVLASALEVPLRERNVLLQAAGFAPAYRETDLDAPEMALVRAAVDHLLLGAEPYGALVMDRHWNLLLANRPWRLLAEATLGRPLAPRENLLRLTVTELRPFVRNGDELVRGMLQRLHREAVATADEELWALLEEVTALPEVPDDWRSAVDRPPPLALTLDLEILGQRLRLFTTLTTLGTPTDVTLSELRLEHYFPADPETDRAVRTLAAMLEEAPTR